MYRRAKASTADKGLTGIRESQMLIGVDHCSARQYGETWGGSQRICWCRLWLLKGLVSRRANTTDSRLAVSNQWLSACWELECHWLETTILATGMEMIFLTFQGLKIEYVEATNNIHKCLGGCSQIMPIRLIT